MPGFLGLPQMTVKPHDEVGVILFGTTGERTLCYTALLELPTFQSVLGHLMVWPGTQNRLTANSEDEEAFDPDEYAHVTVRCERNKRSVFVCVSTLRCEKG